MSPNDKTKYLQKCIWKNIICQGYKGKMKEYQEEHLQPNKERDAVVALFFNKIDKQDSRIQPTQHENVGL